MVDDEELLELVETVRELFNMISQVTIPNRMWFCVTSIGNGVAEWEEKSLS